MAEAISSTLDSDWAWLPSDVLNLILEQLIPITDYIRFGAVCKAWRSVALDKKPQRLKSCHKQLPMLIVTRDGSSALYGVSQGKAYSFELQEHKSYHQNMRCCSFRSSRGWLAYLDSHHLFLTLFNPFTECTILLPQFKQVPESTQEPINRVDFFIDKVVLSADPCLFPNDFEVLILYYDYHSESHVVAHSKAADNTWTHINTRMSLSDAIYHRGQFLVVNSKKGELFSINVNSVPADITGIGATIPPEIILNKTYLVESSRGDLWLVEKSSSHCVDKVWCAFWDDGRPQWVEIESIGTDALFLSEENECMSVSALDFPECHPNSVYFIDNTRGAIFISDLAERRYARYCWTHLLGHKAGLGVLILPTMV